EAERESSKPADGRPAPEVLHARRTARHLPAVSVRDHADAAPHRHRVRIRPCDAHHLPRRHAAPGRPGFLDGRRARQVGRRHSGRRHGEPRRQDLVRRRGKLPQRRAQGHLTLHADRRRAPQLRGDDRRFQGVHAGVEAEHDHLSASREEPRTARVRVRRARLREAVQRARRSAMTISITGSAPLILVLFLPGVGGAQDPPKPPPAERSAPPAPAYPPYTRPVSRYVSPRTADGQPDISGLYLAIPLPRSIETPLVPLANRAPNRANGEFSYSLNERPKLPEGALARPVGVDPADGKIPLTPAALARRKDIIANQEKVEYLDGRVLCLAPGIPRSTVPAPVVGYQIFQKPGA